MSRASSSNSSANSANKGNGNNGNNGHGPNSGPHSDHHGPQGEHGNGYGHYKGNGNNGNNGHGPNSGPHSDQHGPQSEHGNGYGHYKHTSLQVDSEILQPPSNTPEYVPTTNKKRIYSNIQCNIDWIPEDNDNAKHTADGSYTPDPDAVPPSPDGAPISIWLAGKEGAPNDAYLQSVSLTPELTGTYYVNGQAVVDGFTFTDAYGNGFVFTLDSDSQLAIEITAGDVWKPVDLSTLNLSFAPDEKYSDIDFEIGYNATITNGFTTKSGGEYIFVNVDAVADLPDYLGGAEGEVIIGADASGELTASPTEYENGVASQTVGGGLGASGGKTVFTLGDIQFYDYEDSSEEHFVLVRCEGTAEWTIDVSALGEGAYEAFARPDGGVLETIWLDENNREVDPNSPDAKEYYKIMVDDNFLAANAGQAHLTLPVSVGQGTENGAYAFDVKVGAKEKVVVNDPDGNEEEDYENNFAVADVDVVQLKVQALETEVKISTGWAYESGTQAGSAGNPDASGSGLDGQGSFTPSNGTASSAAFIDLAVTLGSGESLGQWVTLKYDASRGDICRSDGTKLNSSGSDGRATVTVPSSYVENGGRLYFVPSDKGDAGDDDSDILISYSFDVQAPGADGETKTFTVNSEIPIVIDAVADPAGMHIAPSGDAPEFEGFTLAYETTFKLDASEAQFLIIKNPNGLLQLGDLGSLASCFTPATAAELSAYENPTAGVGHHFDDIDANDIILRVTDLNALDALDSSNDGTVHIQLPLVVTDRNTAGAELQVEVSTVVVEGNGNRPDAWTQENLPGDPGAQTPGEYDFANNIAVTSQTTTVHLAQAENIAVTPTTSVFEGDKDEQHLRGDTDTPEYGTAIDVSFGDAFEAVREISFSFATSDGSPVDGAMAFGVGTNYTLVPVDGKLLFTAVEDGGEARYTSVQVLDAGNHVIGTYTFAPSTLQELSAAGNASGLRFIPSGDNDADIQVAFTGVRVTDVRSGDVISVNDMPSITIVRDAVADLPVNAASTIAAPGGGHPAVVAGATVTVDATATFSDFADGSEAQYLFVSKGYLASIDIPASHAGSLTLLGTDAANAICAQIDGVSGIPGATADDYFVIKIDPSYLQANSGKLDLPLGATLRTDIAKDGNARIDIKAVAVEHDGFLTGTALGGNAEPDAANNVAVSDMPADIAWATLENVFTFTVETPAYENDQPGQNRGDATPAQGAIISVTPQDGSEVFDTLVISYAGEDGQPATGHVVLSVGGQPLEIPSGATLTFTYDTVDPTLCSAVGYTDTDGAQHSLNVPKLTLQELTSQGLRYVPDASGNDSDVDVHVTFSGTTRETESGETGVYPETTVQVMVDAVADKPGGNTTVYDYGTDSSGQPHTALPESSPISFDVNATFGDVTDGSEAHYLFINTKYLSNDNFQLTDAAGQPFSGGTVVSDAAELATLYARINGDPGLIPGADDTYAVLKIDPAYLAAHGGNLSLTIKGTLKDAAALSPIGPEKTPLNLDVKAVAVEGDGYRTGTSAAPGSGNDETDATNNVAVTDVGTQIQWDALKGEFTLTADTAFEGNQPGQHTGAISLTDGAALAIAPADASEVFTHMALDYDDSHGDMVLTVNDVAGNPVSLVIAPNADLDFAFDPTRPTHIVSVTCGNQSLTVPGLTLADLTANGLRYVPHTGDDDDADVTVTITAGTLETNTGATGAATLSGTIVVDAVADKPADVSSELIVTNGKDTTVIVNENQGIDSFDLNLKAVFTDYGDGSEGHYFFIGADYLAGLEGLPQGVTQLDDAAASGILADAGLSGDYLVLEVNEAYLQANNGTVDVTITAHLDSAKLPDEDHTLHVDIKAGAIEHQGVNTPVGTELANGHGQDADAANNVSLVDTPIDLRYARLDNEFAVREVQAHEGDAPNQHTGDLLPEGGAAIDFAPADASEVFDALKVVYDDAEGSLYLDLPTAEMGHLRLELPDGAELAFAYRNDGAGATLCAAVTVTTADGSASYTLSPQLDVHDLMGDGRLHYIPDANSQSDADVTVTFSGTSRETATGESGDFQHAVLIKVDAVADRPDATGDAANADGISPSLDPGTAFDVSVRADFGKDLQDGSEKHYVLVSREYLASLTIPAATGGAVSLLDDTAAAHVCDQVDGPGGIPGATAQDYFVLEVDAAWLQAGDGKLDLRLEGALKDAAALKNAGGAEGVSLTLDMKAVAVEHQGFQTSESDDLGAAHGIDPTAGNNVAVDDASVDFTYAVVDGGVDIAVAPAYEGDQPGQHAGDLTLDGGAAVTLTPQDDSEVFAELTLNYDDANGSLTLSAPNGGTVTVANGAQLLFSYDPAHPTECLTVQVLQPGDPSPSATLSFADAGSGRGLSLADLTSGYLSYLPDAGDHHDADVAVAFSGTLLETESGAQGPVSGSLTVVVDAVADMPANASGSAVVLTPGGGQRPGAQPGETITVSLQAEFTDYGEDDTTDASEAHYVFIAKENLPTLGGVPGGVEEVTASATLAEIFNAIAKTDGTGIQAGPGAANDYHVLKVSPGYLQTHGGQFSMNMTVTAGPMGVYPVEAKAVAVEHDGYQTDVDGIGGGADRDVTAENNVAVTDMSFQLVVREFASEKVTVTLASEWAYENDRSKGDEKYHEPGDADDRDHGVRILFNGQGDGNVISSVTFEYAMPSNGSTVPHSIESFTEDGAPNPGVTITQTISGDRVTVTVTANEPYGSVGELHFVPGDNYDNDDVDITVTNVEVADPYLHQSTVDAPDWGTGVAPGSGDLHVKIDAVAQAPEVDIFGVDHDSGDPMLAGGEIHIEGQVSFEDIADGSEEHFILLEIQDGYYPDEVTLTLNGKTVTIPVTHYSSDPAVKANYTLQQLVTSDDGQPHLFVKLPVDAALAELNDTGLYERMDDIQMVVAYQTREWAAEGASLHFAAIATEDVDAVREFDVNWNITNDELPFDKQLEKYVPGLTVTDNNTAITVESQGAYVYWDSTDSDALNFKGYVFENDRPSDQQRDPAYILDKENTANDITYSYPVSPELTPYDSVTGRDFGTGMELKIPEHSRQVSITQVPGDLGEGDFYFLPQSVWSAYMKSPAPLTDNGLAQYWVNPNGSVATADPGLGEYTMVFIPSHEAYNNVHSETGASHKDYDFHFGYEILVDQYGPDDSVNGQKKYLGEDAVIRVDAVANQAEIKHAGTEGPEQFSLWNGAGTTSSFDLTVDFHDMDATEDHYVLVEMVPNFAFRCGSYIYQPGNPNSISPNDNESIYTHVMTDENGNQSFIRYYKIPVDMADIDPATGQATVKVELLRQPGMPSVADYPSSQELTYGALTEDKTCSRWDSNDPTADNFINRKGADGEYSYENNTSVIIRNGIENGDPSDGGNSNGWWDGSVTGGSGGGGHIHWVNGPGSGWSEGWIPGGASGEGYWRADGPAGGGDWWKPGGGIGQGTGTIEDWIPAGGGKWNELGGGGGSGGGGHIEVGGGGGMAPDGSDSKWIASRGQGLAIEWVFENSTPLGHTQAGQYAGGIMPAAVYLTGENPNAAYARITIPGADSHVINGGTLSPSKVEHAKATLINATFVPPQLSDGTITYEVNAPGGHLPDNDPPIFLMVAPDSMGEDFQMQVSWYDANGNMLSSGPVDVLVDAVAQWADFEFAEHEDGVYGVTGDDPTSLLQVDVNVNYLDQDRSESNYLLVEKIPGVLPLHSDGNGGYETLREVYLEGKTYYIIEPSEAEQTAGTVPLYISVNEELLSPMYIENDILHTDGQTYTGVRLSVGTMTVEGQIGRAADGDAPANWEYTLDNNTSLNLKEDYLSIFVSKVNAQGGDNAVMAKETAAPEDNLLRLDPDDPANGLNLTMDGNDTLISLIFTGATGNGSFWYEDDAGARHPLPTGVNMADAYLAGKIYHMQDRYQDADATLTWQATVRDGITDNSEITVGGTLTVAVDAVAKSEEIHLTFPVLDKQGGTLTQTLTFDDHDANEQHYAVIAPDLYRVVGKQAEVKGADGTWNTVEVETIFDPSGNPYYAVAVDGYLGADGSVTVRFGMHELNIPGIENFPVISGGVSVEPNAGYNANDREMNLADNWAINTKAEFVNEGVVGSKDLAFAAVQIVEDDAAGAPITLIGSVDANDMLLSAVLTFTPQAAALAAESGARAGNVGDQIATIVYNGQCFAVTQDGAGNAVANVDFGTGGFDPTADFRIIWGSAHMQDGKLVVDEWNHAADGVLDLNTVFTVQNTVSGQTQTISGADPDGVVLTARADEAEAVSGDVSAVNGNAATPADLVGAGGDSVTVTVRGEFADVDGSENHALLLEVPEGWQVSAPLDGTYETVNGTRYYRVNVDGTETHPSADITLVSPDGLNGDVDLKSGAWAEEGNGDSLFTPGDPVTLHMSDVSATSVSANVSPVQEDAPLSLASLADAALLKADGNDTLLSVTFTDLKGGSIVDADGNTVADPTFTKADLASGRYFYLPAANYAGEMDASGTPLPIKLVYDALLGETDTGATATLSGQTLNVTVIPMADAPENIAGVSDTALGDVQTGHKAAVSVTLEARFEDVDGSEEHFFVLSGPQGVAVKGGSGYAVALFTAEEAATMGLSDRFQGGEQLYKVTLDDSTLASVALAVNLEVTTTVYNGGELVFVGGAAELRQDGEYSYATSGAQNVTLPPAIEHGIGNSAPVAQESASGVDSLRADGIEGAIATDVDPDGDAVTAGGVSFNGTPGVRDSVDGRDCYTVRGQHGTLHFFDDGAYRYVLDPAHRGVAGQEVFDYQIMDGYGGSSSSAITIDLTNANTAPSAENVDTRLDSVRQTVVKGDLTLDDAEGDAVDVVSVNGTTTLQNFGTAEAPLWGFETAGQYGMVRVYEEGGQWKYAYTLAQDHRGEVNDESFTFTVRDAYGLESTGTVGIDLYNMNNNPVAEAGTSALDTLRDADRTVRGDVALSDADGDAVRLDAVTGPRGEGAWGTDDKGETAFVVWGDHGTLYLYQSGDATLSYRYVLTDTTAGGLDATETFTYTVDDGYLGTASSTITIGLSNANGAPEITGDLTNELDTLRDADRTTEGGLVFADPDYNVDAGRHDQTTLTGVHFGSGGGTSDGSGGFTVNGAHGQFHIAADGAYTYTLNPDAVGETGEEVFTVTVADEFGASREESVTIELLVHNQNPTASSGSVELNTWRGGGKTTGQVALADADGDTVRVDSVSGAAAGVWGVDDQGDPAFVVRGGYGTLYLHEDGGYRYVLNADARGQSGEDVFSYTAQDGFGGSASSTITIHLDDANAAPVLSGDLSVSIGGNIGNYGDGPVQESGLLSWSDADGDAIASVSVGGVDLPASGEVSIDGRYGILVLTMTGGNEASYSYTLKPGVDAQGITDVDDFGIVVRDIHGGESAQELFINLSPLSHAPECDDVNLNWPKTPSGDLISYLEGQLSFHDTDMDYDASESLTLAVNGTAITEDTQIEGLHGTLSIKADGTFSYTAMDKLGQDLLEEFTYTVTDQAGNTDTSCLYIRLSDNAPVFPNTGTTEEGIIVTAAEGDAAAFMEHRGFLDVLESNAEEPVAQASEVDAAPAFDSHVYDSEPVEIALTSVPLPHDVDAAQSLCA